MRAAGNAGGGEKLFFNRKWIRMNTDMQKRIFLFFSQPKIISKKYCNQFGI
jgi:hypothetical protein